MLKKPENYDEVQVNQEFERLEVGGHKGIIKKVEEYTSTISGNTSLKVEVDTAKDDKQPEYFQQQFDNNTTPDKKWSTAGTKYVSLREDETCVRMLKAFITSVENSNPGFAYDWNKEIDQLNGKKVGLLVGQEEYEDNEGKTKLATKVVQFRSIDKVENLQPPKVKLLDGSFVDYNEYSKEKETKNTSVDDVFGDSIEIDDGFLD